MPELIINIRCNLKQQIATFVNFTEHKMSLQIGKTKVFLRAGQMAELDARRAEVLSDAANTIQRRARTHIARKHFLALRDASICLQSFCRGDTSGLFYCYMLDFLKLKLWYYLVSSHYQLFL